MYEITSHDSKLLAYQLSLLRIGPIGSAICVYNANNTGDSTTRPGLFDVYRGDFADNGVVNDFVEV